MSAPLRNQWRPSAKSEASVSVLQRNHRGYCARLRCWRFLERAQSSHWRHERVTERQSASDPAPPIICCENLLRWLILVCLALFWTVDTKCSEFCSRQNKSTSTTATWLGQKAIKEPVDFIDRLGDCPESTLAISAMLFLPLLAVAVEFWLEIPGQKPGWASVFALGSGWRRWLERA